MRFVERPNLVSPRGSERVASRVVWTGTLAVEAPPYAAGAQLRADSSMHFTFRDGRILRQENFDCFQAPADP
jgi:ketosteroid isomerase-like protein